MSFIGAQVCIRFIDLLPRWHQAMFPLYFEEAIITRKIYHKSIYTDSFIWLIIQGQDDFVCITNNSNKY